MKIFRKKEKGAFMNRRRPKERSSQRKYGSWRPISKS
jgi:hypothetical protein